VNLKLLLITDRTAIYFLTLENSQQPLGENPHLTDHRVGIYCGLSIRFGHLRIPRSVTVGEVPLNPQLKPKPHSTALWPKHVYTKSTQQTLVVS